MTGTGIKAEIKKVQDAFMNFHKETKEKKYQFKNAINLLKYKELYELLMDKEPSIVAGNIIKKTKDFNCYLTSEFQSNEKWMKYIKASCNFRVKMMMETLLECHRIAG